MKRSGRTLEPVEIVSCLYEAMNHGSIEALCDRVDATIEFHPLPLTGGRVWQGHEGIASWWRELQRSGVEYLVEIDDVHPLADDQVIAIGRFIASGATTSFVALHRLRGERVVRMDHYFSNPDALRAAGHLHQERR